METVVYNNSNLTDKDINRVVKRAKLLIENDKEELLLAYSHNNYFTIGGHIEKDETDFECIKREVKEETGIDLHDEDFKPIISIVYYCKDYPEIGVNSKYVGNYYSTYCNDKVVKRDMNLTEDEKEGNFKCVYLPKCDALKILNDSLSTCSWERVVKDTYLVIENYLKKTDC